MRHITQCKGCWSNERRSPRENQGPNNEPPPISGATHRGKLGEQGKTIWDCVIATRESLSPVEPANADAEGRWNTPISKPAYSTMIRLKIRRCRMSPVSSIEDRGGFWECLMILTSTVAVSRWFCPEREPLAAARVSQNHEDTGVKGLLTKMLRP